jgi:hypothetical protein
LILSSVAIGSPSDTLKITENVKPILLDKWFGYYRT